MNLSGRTVGFRFLVMTGALRLRVSLALCVGSVALIWFGLRAPLKEVLRSSPDVAATADWEERDLDSTGGGELVASAGEGAPSGRRSLTEVGGPEAEPGPQSAGSRASLTPVVRGAPLSWDNPRFGRIFAEGFDLSDLERTYGLPAMQVGSPQELQVRSILRQWGELARPFMGRITPERGRAKMDKVRARIDSARIGTPEAELLRSLADSNPNAVVGTVMCGPGVIEPGDAGGTALVLVRRGDHAPLDLAIDELWSLHDAAIEELSYLLGSGVGE